MQSGVASRVFRDVLDVVVDSLINTVTKSHAVQDALKQPDPKKQQKPPTKKKASDKKNPKGIIDTYA